MANNVTRNGKAFDAAGIKIFMLGRNFFLQECSYSKKVPHENHYSLGSREATDYSMGNEELSCSIKIKLADLKEIGESAPDGDLYKIKPFWITVELSNEDGLVFYDQIFAKFTEDSRELAADSSNISSSIELHTLKIRFNKEL